MLLDEWAEKWGISRMALNDLKMSFGVVEDGTDVKGYPHKESNVQRIVRIEASQQGGRLWRNNVGATYTRAGTFLRYGLANDSRAVNDVLKSADLIGIRPIKITPLHIGRTIGQFVSREVKTSNWVYTGNDREKAQLRWATLIASMGGDACFCTGRGTL